MCHSEIIHYLPFDYVVSSWSMENDFFRFLRESCHVSVAELECLLCRYLIGSTRDGGIIYWQLDFNGNVRTGKIMHYDRNTRHRVKTGLVLIGSAPDFDEKDCYRRTFLLVSASLASICLEAMT